MSMEIKTNGDYKNVSLKNKYKVEDGKKVITQQGINPGESAILEKIFAEGQERDGKFGTFFSCKAKLETGDEVSFILNPKQHEAFRTCGGVGDKVRETVTKETFINPKNGNEGMYEALNFDLVEDVI
jgi:hypothetical protein